VKKFPSARQSFPPHLPSITAYQTVLTSARGRRDRQVRVGSINRGINSLGLRQTNVERLASEVVRDPLRRAQFPRRVRLRTNRLLASTSLDGAAVLGWCLGDAEAVVAGGRGCVADVAEVVVGACGLEDC